jgi:type IX secretion system PorP/SprF family membrane protein
MKKSYFLIVCILSCTSFLFSQDIHFSQFNESPLTLNPALTAATVDMRAILNYRNQWKSVTVPYETYGASFEMKARLMQWKKQAHTTGTFSKAKKNLALGLNFFRDKAGDAAMGTTQANLTIATNLNIDENNSIGAGIQGGIAQRSISYAKIKWDNQYNGTSYNSALPSGESTVPSSFIYGDYSAGIQWNYGKGEMYIAANNEVKANAGFAVYHVSQPKQSFIGDKEKLFSKFAFHGGCVFGIKNTNVLLAPSFMYLRQGPLQELNIGTMIKYKLREDTKYTGFKQGAAVSIGGYYRNRDAVAIVGQIEVGRYSMGISYDVNLSGLKKVSTGRGGVEISLRFVSPNPYLYQAKSRI